MIRSRADHAIRGQAVAGICTANGGYVLIELMLALVIVSLLAGLALPRASATGGVSELRSIAARIAVLLRADRNAALRRGQPVVSQLDRQSGAVRSGSGANTVVLPPHYRMLVSDRLAGGVRFDPDGQAPVGDIAILNAREQRVVLRIDPVSAAVYVQGSEARHAP